MDPSDFIQDEAALRALHQPPSDLAANKCIAELEPHSRRFIELSPFLCIASSEPGGPADISPRGDAPGFVRVLDDRTLLIPDRIGNNRLDTSANITQNPQIGLIFLVPGVNETLRINGRARICSDAEVLADFAVRGKVPKTGILVAIEEVMFQCAKALVRSRLWDDDYKVERTTAMPPLGHMIKDQLGSPDSADDVEAYVQKSLRERLY
ncbi:MAG: pyridoxamine 5'-phosphate oxidase family protein [Alphaproteobacteria bacterium]|jgi:hypothetical protein|nr:pyridoxamine 5'-phosphate oxidase family protein [Alphaproteobacteria bacterium]MDP6566607.1 pyridoxamine 5'-phosphate oxidase family protein [Alphaproteobacteria bacterium]MDP6815587.1 pyridoxamine 5'-phosphate oxidase family protein [Alphaproteobacteria bacterium]